jgi:hypothetical protein
MNQGGVPLMLSLSKHGAGFLRQAPREPLHRSLDSLIGVGIGIGIGWLE